MQSDGQVEPSVVPCTPMDTVEGLKAQLTALLEDLRLAGPAGSSLIGHVETLIRQALGTLAIEPESFGAVLKAAREEAGLSHRRLAKLAGLSDRTLKNIEKSLVAPRAETLARLYAVAELRLSQRLSERAELPTPSGWRPNSWFAPRYEPARLLRDLVDLVNGPGGTLEQTALYIDSRSAMDYLELCNSAPLYQAFRRATPFDRLAAVCVKLLNGARAVVINGLGSGDGTAESAFVRELAALHPARMRLQLLDISHTLLSVAHRVAEEMLSPYGVEIVSLHANFHDLARYPVLHGERGGDPRVYLLLGATMANVENEVRFFGELATVAAPGDLLVVDCQTVRAPASNPDEVRKVETQIGTGPAAFNLDWMTGPIRRHCRGAVDVKMSVELAPHTIVPGSYELDCYATVHMESGPPRRFLVLRGKRYDPPMLAEFLKTLGWVAVDTLRTDGAALLVFCRGGDHDTMK